MMFFFQAEDGIRDYKVTGVQTCSLPIWGWPVSSRYPRRTGKSRASDKGYLLKRLPRAVSSLRSQPQQRGVPLREERLRPQARTSRPIEAGLVQKAIKRYTIGLQSGCLKWRLVTRSWNAESKATTL